MQDSTSIAPRLMTSSDSSAADDILRIAFENDVPLRRDSALVGALATFDVGAQIPPELCRAVAEVLAFVYSLEGKG